MIYNWFYSKQPHLNKQYCTYTHSFPLKICTTHVPKHTWVLKGLYEYKLNIQKKSTNQLQIVFIMNKYTDTLNYDMTLNDTCTVPPHKLAWLKSSCQLRPGVKRTKLATAFTGMILVLKHRHSSFNTAPKYTVSL